MGLRFRRSVKLAPGVRLNFGLRGTSVSVGPRGAKLTFSQRGTYGSFGIPGTGLSWRERVDGGGARRAASSGSIARPVRSSEIESADHLRQALQDPNTVLVNPSSGRRLSERQIEALHRRLVLDAANASAQARVDAFEATVAGRVNAWRLPLQVPDDSFYRAQLEHRAFEDRSSPPPPPGEPVFESRSRRRPSPGVAPQVVGAALGTAAAASLAGAFGVGAGVVGAVLAAASSVLLGMMWRRTEIVDVDSEAALVLADHWKRLQSYRTACSQHEAEQERLLVEHDEEERARRTWAQRLISGDVEAVYMELIDTLGALDFPFDCNADLGLDDAEEAYLHIDLPEIEDVIPEAQYRVLKKDGSVKRQNRNKGQRYDEYCELVCGLAVALAASCFAAAPTLRTAHVAAYTQRRRGRSVDIHDDYVIVADLRRELFGAVVLATADPAAILSQAGAVIDPKGSGELKRVAAPPWVRQYFGDGREA